MQNFVTRGAVVLSLFALLVLASGCQMFVSSSRSFASMASIWSLSASFTSSFGGGGGDLALDEAYAFDIAKVGATAAGSQAPAAMLLDDVTRVAETHGVTDWEALEETWLGLGIGLRHMGMSEGETEALVSQVFGAEMAARTVASVYTE